MSATDFLCVQLVGNVLLAWLLRARLGDSWRRLMRTLLFTAITSYSFDYMANDLGVWHFVGDWDVLVLRNPLENTLFAITMAFQFLLICLVMENHTATNSHRWQKTATPPRLQ